MEKSKKTTKTTTVVQGTAWETRHDNDARGPLAANSSQMPDRSARGSEGAAGEMEPVHASGYQQGADAAHPNFPDQGTGSMASDSGDDTEAVRRRAYQLWQDEGFPEGGHERHWLQAEREIRGGTPGE
jgi:hypothetical protein